MSEDDFEPDEEELKRMRKKRPPSPKKKEASKAVKKAKGGKQSAAKLSQQLFTAVKRAVKKQGHSEQKKPWAEPVSVVWPDEVWHELLDDCPSTSESKAMIKKIVPAKYAVEHLGWEKAIHPVKFSGKTWALMGSRPQVYAIAGYDTIEFRFKPSTGLVTCKVRTVLSMTGNQDIEVRIAQIEYE
jgi:hypothetical protein